MLHYLFIYRLKNRNHVDIAIKLAIEIYSLAKQYSFPLIHEQVQVRIGIATGLVVAGIIGKNKYAYDCMCSVFVFVFVFVLVLVLVLVLFCIFLLLLLFLMSCIKLKVGQTPQILHREWSQMVGMDICKQLNKHMHYPVIKNILKKGV
jgi:Adenylate and Guanylate cyclase catalytic domain